MDRIDAMVAFVTVADAGGFSAAARKLGRSPAGITRAVALLEARTGSTLLQRTTRVVKLTDAGQRYLAACRSILSELAAAEQHEEDVKAVPRGLLTVSAPVMFGRLHVRALVDGFLAANPETSARLLLLDRLVNLVDEGVDVAVRIAHLPDSSLIATKVGEVRQVLCASRSYLTRKSKPKTPADLARHDCIATSATDTWTFKSAHDDRTKQIKIRPRLSVNAVDAAIDSAIDGHGIARVLSYQIAQVLRDGRLVRLLPSFEPEPLPIHVVRAATSATTAKMRAFVDLVVPRLRQSLRRA